MVIDCFKLVKGAGKSVGIYNVALNITQNLVLGRSRSEDLVAKDIENLKRFSDAIWAELYWKEIMD